MPDDAIKSAQDTSPTKVEARTGCVPARSRRRWAVVAGGVPGLLTVAMIAGYGAFASWKSSDSIAPGVTIAGEAVGGLTQSQAQEVLERRFGKLFLNLEAPEQNYKLSLAELGGQPLFKDTVTRAYAVGREAGHLANVWTVYETRATGQSLSLPVTWKKDELLTRLKTVRGLYREPAQNARLRITPAGVVVEAEKIGRDLNLGETARLLQAQYYVGKPRLAAAVVPVEPAVTRTSLEGTDVRLAYFTTRFNPRERGRTVNVRTAADAVSGRAVAPGEEFSFNQSTGKRTAAKGYKMAHIFVRAPGAEESEIVDGLAGGTCQVSTTLYNAVRVLNDKMPGAIKIVERNVHSLPVPYVRTGRDATVAWPNVDFRFRNSLKHPVYLRTEVAGSRLVVSVWGRVPRTGSNVSASSDAPLEAENVEPEKSIGIGLDSAVGAGRDAESVPVNPEQA